MKIKTRRIGLVAIAFMLLSVVACQKENEKKVDPNAKGDVSFGITLGQSSLKSGSVNTLDDVTEMVITIETVTGEATDYTSYSLKFYSMNGSYFSQKVSLPVGDYNLTECLMLDASGEAIFAVPVAGSPLAANVSQPLPIRFDIGKDAVTALELEVLVICCDLTPADFGLFGFNNISMVDAFCFYMNVSELGQFDSFITSDLQVESGTYGFDQYLPAVANNQVVVKKGFENYTLTVSKDGYETYTYTFPIDSLEYYEKTPLTIELVKSGNELVVDIDGNEYETVKLGTQIWMTKNMRVTRYADGTPIANVESNAEWSNLSIDAKAYSWYKNDSLSYGEYGAYYTKSGATNADAYGISNGAEVQGVCPDGWRVPNSEDYRIFVDYLAKNGYNYDNSISDYSDAKVSKALANNFGWKEATGEGEVGNNQLDNNKTGMDIFPTSFRVPGGGFGTTGATAYLWKGENGFKTFGFYFNSNSPINFGLASNFGLPVRCMKYVE